MKIHFFSIFKYIVGFVFIIFFILLFEQSFLVVLLFPFILLPAILIPLFLSNYRKLTFNAYSTLESVEAGTPITYRFTSTNPTILPFANCAICFTIKNEYYENKLEHILNAAVLPKKTSSVEIPVDTGKLGMVTFECHKILISDFLGFITKEVPVSIKVEVPVLPGQRVDVEAFETPSSEGFDEYSEPDLKGDLSSDIKEIREYRPGDRLQRIHWKLSAKLDDLFVKEMDHTSVMSLIVLPELEKDSIETTITYLDSLAKDLCNRNERFEICLFNNATCDFEYFLVDRPEVMYQCYMHLYYLPLYESKEAARAAYYASSQKSSIIVSICGNDIKMFEDGLEVAQI